MAMSDNGEDFIHVVVLITEEVLSCGLQVSGLSKKSINRVEKIDPLLSTTNHQRFKDCFGVIHVAAVQIWEDLQKTGVAADNITFENPKT